MINSAIRLALCFVAFLLLQVAVLNNLHFLRLATPFIYIYVVLKMPVETKPDRLLLLAFAMGLAVDAFSNTAGMHAAASTLAALARRPAINLFSDNRETGIPAFATFGRAAFMRYAFAIALIHHTALFLIESLTLFDPLFLVVRIVASICLTIILIFLIESFNIKLSDYNEP